MSHPLNDDVDSGLPCLPIRTVGTTAWRCCRAQRLAACPVLLLVFPSFLGACWLTWTAPAQLFVVSKQAQNEWWEARPLQHCTHQQGHWALMAGCAWPAWGARRGVARLQRRCLLGPPCRRAR
jgi:hypothetical protein